MLLNPRRPSSIPVSPPQSLSALLNPLGPPQSGLVLRYFIQRSIVPFLSALLLYDGRSSIPSSTSIRSASISFQTLYLPSRFALLSMDGLFRCIGAPQSPSALLGLDLRPSISFCITISTPLDLPHDIRHSSSPGGAPLFPPNSSYCLSKSILIHRTLTSIPTLLDITNRAK